MADRNDFAGARAGSVVLVTGASSGIGQETALHYAARGAHLVLAARSGSGLRQVARMCRAAGATEVLVQSTDISDQDQVESLFEAAVARFGRVDVAVQCASVPAFGRFTDVPTKVFDEVIETNVCGAANVARSALVCFRQRGRGQLVLVGSLLGKVVVPYMAPYVMSKFAVSGLVRLLQQETRDMPGIAVHGIYPGAVDTPIYGNSANYYGREARVPPLIADTPEVVAAAIVRATKRGTSRERSVGLENIPMLLASRFLPAIFDALIGPLMRATSFTNSPVAPTSGNLSGRHPVAPSPTRIYQDGPR